MSKKSRKNSSKPATTKAAAAISRTAAKKTVRRAEAVGPKKVAKKAAKPVAAKAEKSAMRATKPVPPKTAKKAGSPLAKPGRIAKARPVSSPPVPEPRKLKPKSHPAVQPVERLVPAPVAPAIAIEGAPAPDFKLPSAGGGHISLRDYAGQKLIIFFYPRANTPGCTKEAIDFTRLADDFAAAKTAVLGVSADPLKAQENFRDKYDLAIPLLSDETHAMLESYGVWGEKSMYGKVFEGVLRTTVLIDASGIVAKIWRAVKVDGHADSVLEAARGL